MAELFSAHAAAKDAKNLLFLTNGISNDKPASSSRFTLGREERLSGKKIVVRLFESGLSFSEYPFRIYFLSAELPTRSSVQVLFSVPKKKFPKAHDRNRIRRLMREGWRKNKEVFLRQCIDQKIQVAVALVYTSKKITAFNAAEDKIKVVLSRLIQNVQGK